jgi:hypothetical protein
VGGIALKFTSPGFVGVPDRLVLMPGGPYGINCKVFAIELDTDIEEVKPLVKEKV